MNRDSSDHQREVGFPLPQESTRLSPTMRNINAAVVIVLAFIGFWLCHQYQVWNMGHGTIFHVFLHRFWMIIPIACAILPVAAYSVPLLILQERRQRAELQTITETSEPRKLR
jgi:hypothetical protein